MTFKEVMDKRQLLYSAFLASTRMVQTIYPIDPKMIYVIYANFNFDNTNKFIFSECTYKNEKYKIISILNDGFIFIKNIDVPTKVERTYYEDVEVDIEI